MGLNRTSEIQRFIAVGIINTLFGYGVYSLLLMIHVNPTLAIILASVLGVLFNFKTIGRFVFKNNNQRLLVKFILVYLVALLVNLSLEYGFFLYWHNAYLAGLGSLLVTSVVSFVLNRNFVFQQQDVVCEKIN